MFEIVIASVNAVLPIVLLILVGYFLKRIKFLNGTFLKIGNKFVFNVCLPCMLFINIYDSMDSFSDIRWDVVAYAVVIIFVLFGIGLLTAMLTTKKNSRRGVLLQCAFRSNFAIIGLTLVRRLGGDGGVAGVVSAFSIPVFNILAVIALTVFNGAGEEEATKLPLNPDGLQGQQAATPLSCESERGKINIKSVLLNIIKNPLIIGVIVGLVFVGIREIERACCNGLVPFRFDTQLKFLYTCVDDLNAIASPLALVVLGGQLEFSAARGMAKEIITGTLFRIVIAPLLGIGAAILLSKYTNLFTFGTEIYPTLIALFGSPVAVSSAIMAGQMKGDEQLATQLVVWTSIGSILTVFITVFALMSCGLLSAI